MDLVSFLPDSFPEIAAEWAPENSSPVDQERPTYQQRRLWVCSRCGRRWEATTLSRTAGSGTSTGPYCAVCRRADRIAGKSLADLHPDIAALWDHARNDLGPADVLPQSGKRVAWACPTCGETWSCKVQQQVVRSNPLQGPHCRHRREKSFADTHPEYVEFWDPDNDRTPYQVSPASTYSARWILPDGTRLTKRVADVRKGGVYQFPVHPVSEEPYGQEWSPRNESSPRMVGRSWKEPVWWECGTCGAEWETAPFNRFNGKGQCPTCREAERAAQAAVKEAALEKARREKELAREEERRRRERAEEHRRVVAARKIERARAAGRLLSQVAPEVGCQLADGVDPDTVLAGSGKPLTWVCEQGHRWEATPHDRVTHESGCPVCSGRTTLPGVNDMVTLFPAIAAEWSPRNPEPADAVSPGSNTPAWWVCGICGNEWATAPNYRCHLGYGCQACFRAGRSGQENALADAVAAMSTAGEVTRNARPYDDRREVDIWLEKHQLGIEFNGLYWHSEACGKGRDYHAGKTRDADTAGFRIIHVWADEWDARPEAVLSHIAAVIGADDRPRVGARTCAVDLNVAHPEMSEFLDAHHIQGPASGSRRFGLRGPDGSLVAGMVVRVDHGTWTISRYATSVNVPGGFTRLLSRLREVVATAGGGKIVTFSDKAVSRGGLYARSGFTLDGELAPDYRYVVDRRRVHKFRYRLDRFRRDPDLEFVEGLTERELAARNGLYRIWDAGKLRWAMEVPATVS
jgi:very-short-patch-repair endonuclease